MNANTLGRLPAHLRQYVVNQDYSKYDQVDQCVWRFVLLQTYNELKDTAHPAYIKGLKQTGISVDYIPKIEEMDRCLSEYGWGAVCVDGFIPPRAFQEFQSLGIMTIATDIRTAAHLAYTPAPDIIHESAGHSPIVPDPQYRAFLRQFGEIGKRAFSSAEDLAVYNAIRNLSVVKEDPSSSPKDIDLAEKMLQQALENVTFLTEASLMSRLHWWTVEYGLVGTPQDYKIYGAGLLSSVGESYFCHDPAIRKLPLTRACIDQGYDITKPQPQLFVAKDFEHLSAVLDEVAHDLAFRQGGVEALHKFKLSEEIGTARLNSGLQISGKLEQYMLDRGEPIFLKFEGPCSLNYEDKQMQGHDKSAHPHGYSTPIGPLEDGTVLSHCTRDDLARLNLRQGSPCNLTYKSGFRLNGTLDKVTTARDGRLLLLQFSNAKVNRGDDVYFLPDWGVFDLAVGETVDSTFAGPADEQYWPATEFSNKTVPPEKNLSKADLELLDLYQRAMDAWDKHDSDPQFVLDEFKTIDDILDDHFSDEWLLRWNLLESLKKVDRGVMLSSHLRNKLLEIEKRHYEDAPITMGLKYLGFIEKAQA